MVQFVILLVFTHKYCKYVIYLILLLNIGNDTIGKDKANGTRTIFRKNKRVDKNNNKENRIINKARCSQCVCIVHLATHQD